MLDRTSPVPLHHQLSGLLGRLIASGHYRPGEAIPPERQLCVMYGVSITTVRQAVLDLAAQGVVERTVGRGTFVRAPVRAVARIGLVATHDQTLSEPSIMPVVAAMQEAAGVAKASLTSIQQEAPGPLADFLRAAIGRGDVQGIVLFTHQSPRYADIAELAASGFPYLVFNRSLDERPFNCIVMNDREAARDAVAYLYQLGHRAIAHLPGSAKMALGRDRQAGYCEAMRQRGLTPWLLDGGWLSGEGEAATTALLAAGPLPTAILAASDATATGAIRVLRRAGLRVPEDISIVGFANLPGSDMVDPPLTTMGYDRRRMGELIIQALSGLIQGGPPPGKIVVPAQFIERQSCGPARRP